MHTAQCQVHLSVSSSDATPMPTCEQKEMKKETTARVGDTKSAQKAAVRNVSPGADAALGNERVGPGVGGARDESGAGLSSGYASYASAKQVGTPRPTRTPVPQRQTQPKSPVCVAAQRQTPLRLRGGSPGVLPKGREQSERQLVAWGWAGGSRACGSINWQNIAELAGYTLKRPLNSGAYGCVFLAHSTLYNCRVALKCIMKRRPGAPTAAAAGQKAGEKTGEKTGDLFVEKYLPRELELVTALHHPNIVKYYDTIDCELYALISMEYVGGGMLLEYLNHMGALSEKEACALFLQLWSAVWHLHLYWICHRDIKPDNLMLDSHLCLKLVDFGFARRVDPHEYVRVRPADGQAQAQRLWFGDAAERDGDEVFAKAISYCGTPAYEARELLLEQPYDPFLADLWSMGVVLYMMLFRRMPFPDCLQHEKRRLVQQPLVYPSYPRVSDEAKALLDAVFVAQENRLRLPEMREHQWTVRFFPLRHNLVEPIPPPAAGEPQAGATRATVAANDSSQSQSQSSPREPSVSCYGAPKPRGPPRDAAEERLNDKAEDVVGACGGAAAAVIDSDSNNSVPVPLTLKSIRIPLAADSAAHTTKLVSAAVTTAAGVAGGAGGLDIGAGERGPRQTGGGVDVGVGVGAARGGSRSSSAMPPKSGRRVFQMEAGAFAVRVSLENGEKRVVVPASLRHRRLAHEATGECSKPLLQSGTTTVAFCVPNLQRA